VGTVDLQMCKKEVEVISYPPEGAEILEVLRRVLSEK